MHPTTSTAYLHSPLVFYMEEDQEEYIFDPKEEYLDCMEVHSNTLIQLKRWFTSSGQT